MPRAFRLFCGLPLVFLLAGCAEPPSKEMNQAQGAIDAARAAGAEQYAPQEFTAAVDALRQSENAATQNDYRLALSLAIDSRERAQNAAKTAVERRAEARGAAERVIAELNSAIAQARSRLDEPAITKLPRRTLANARAALDAVEKTMQEARAAVDRNEYQRAMTLTAGVMSQIEETLSALDKAAAPPPARKRR